MGKIDGKWQAEPAATATADAVAQAIKKINTEIQKQPNNPYLAVVGEHIIDCITTESAANAVLAEDKTLAGAMQYVLTNPKKEAEEEHKKKGGSCIPIVVDSETVFRQMREYFGLDKLQAAPKKKGICLNFNDFM